MAASTRTIVAQGAETDVFTEPADGWRNAAPSASLVDPNAAGTGTGLSISKDTVVAAFASSATPAVEDVFVKPPSGWSGAVTPAAHLVPPEGHQTVFDGVIAGQVIAAQTTDARQRLGPVGVYVKPARGWSGAIRPRARLVVKNARAGLGQADVAISSHTIFVSGRSVVYVFTEPPRGWSGTIRPSARLRATGSVTVAGTSVLVGADQVFSKPTHGWSGNVTPTATITAPFRPINQTSQTSSPTTLITSISIMSSVCATDGCPTYIATVSRPRHGWTGRLHQTTIIGANIQPETVPIALSGPNLVLTAGQDLQVYRLSNHSTH